MKQEKFFVIKDEATGMYYCEEDGGGGPGSYTIRDWTKDVHDAERFSIDDEFDREGHYKNSAAQDFVHPDSFRMPPTARVVRILVTEEIKILSCGQ